MKKLHLLYFSFIILLTNNCNSIDCEEYNITQEKFIVESFDKIYTNSLSHYESAIKYWSENKYKGYANHFPSKLHECNQYEFLFAPRIMQGGANLEMSIKFPNSITAQKYFNKYSKGYIKEYESYKKYKMNGHCMRNLNLISKVQIKDSSRVRIFEDIKCIGKNLNAIGSIDRGISIDLENNVVFIWSTEYY